MNIHLHTDDDFSVFKNALRKKIETRTKRVLDADGRKLSAVMMLIFNYRGAPHVVLTQRTHKVATHKGEISFPGGGIDGSDRDILDTAYRETEEEVGIHRGSIDYIGQYDDYLSIYGFHVCVFVGAIDYPFSYSVNTDEIEKMVFPPLEIFTRKQYDRFEIFSYQGQDYKVYYYTFDGNTIWGMTARILTDFCLELCS